MALEKFDFSYNRKWSDTHGHNVLKTQFESGKTQRRYKGPKPRRFTLEFDKQNMNSDEPQQILDFFNARKGETEPFLFDYVHSDGTVEEMTVIFGTSKLNRDITADTIYRFTIPFEEVL